MAKAWRPDFDEVPIDEPLTLVVGWKKGARTDGRHVKLAAPVRNALRDACRRTVEQAAGSTAVDFGPDAIIEMDEYMAVPRHVVAGEAKDVLGLLDQAAGLETLNPSEIPKLWFYAAVVGDDPANRAAFVRKTDPHLTAKPGWVVTTLGETLARISDPVFVLESRFDVIVARDGLVVLNATPFETLFRGAEEMSDRVSTWAEAVTDHVPISAEGAEILVAAARRSARLAKRLRSIYDSGHLAKVTLAQLKSAAKAQGLNVTDLFGKNELVVNEKTDTMTLLALLNEDLFKGGLTGTAFAADRKRPR